MGFKKVRLIAVIILGITLLSLLAACANPTPTPTAQPTPTPQSSPTQTAKPSPSPSPAPAPAGPTPAEFYKGKTLNWIVPTGVGAKDDAVARIIAPTLAEYIGASAVVVTNKDEAGGIAAWNYLWESKSQGLEFGYIGPGDVVVGVAKKNPAYRFTPEEFTYLGFGFPQKWLFLVVSEAGPYRTLDDLKNAKDLKVSVSGPFDEYHLVLATATAALNLDGKIAGGMKGSERLLMITNNTINYTVFHVDYFQKSLDPGRALIPLVVASSQRHPDYPDVPTLLEIAPKDLSPELKTMVNLSSTTMVQGNTFVTQPGVPADRAKFLGDALKKAVLAHLPEVTKIWGMNFTEADLADPQTVLADMKENLEQKDTLGDLIDKVFADTKA